MYYDEVNEAYFNWLYNIVCGGLFPSRISYRKLLSFLHDKEFIAIIKRDDNRASDGVDLRYMFSEEMYYNNKILKFKNINCPTDEDDCLVKYIKEPCSILEVMVAIAIICEESIMTDPSYGDRTKQWFWGMIRSLGLNSMDDDHFNLDEAEEIVWKFINREYEPNGKGGLFTIPDCRDDLREAEIWCQLHWYLNTIS